MSAQTAPEGPALEQQQGSCAGDGVHRGRGGGVRQQPAHPQYANYWAPLTRKQHTMPHSAQSQHANYWAPRTRKRHQQEHRPQRPTESSDPTQHAKGRTGDRPGPRKGATTRRNVTQGGYGLKNEHLMICVWHSAGWSRWRRLNQPSSPFYVRVPHLSQRKAPAAMSLKSFFFLTSLLCDLVPSWSGLAFNVCIPQRQ